MSRLYPPKKKDWTEGTPQVGTFLRTAIGSVIESCKDKATADDQMVCLILATGGVKKLPADLLTGLRTFWESQSSK